MLHEGVDVSQFVVVKGEIGLDHGILQKLVAGLLVILFLQIGQSEVEMHKRQSRIALDGGLQLGERHVVLLKIQMALADQHVEFGRAFAGVH